MVKDSKPPAPSAGHDLFQSRAKGKQMLTRPPKAGQGADAYFGMIYNPQPGATDSELPKYAGADKRKVNGFLSSNPPRRDEFSHVLKERQYREALRNEDKHRPRFLPPIEKPPPKPRTPPPSLYDRVFEKMGPPDPEWNRKIIRCAQETHNPTRLNPNGERRLGPYRTTSSDMSAYSVPIPQPRYPRRQ